MTRQEQITLEQVRAKRNEAATRSTRKLDQALVAETEEEYERLIAEAHKAAVDFDTWTKALYYIKGAVT